MTALHDGTARATINGHRLWSSLMRLAEIGSYTDERTGLHGVNRLALTDAEAAGRRLVVGWMREAGLQLRVDEFGNVYGRRAGRLPDAPPVLVGSHIDSVATAGAFDGVLGVLGGLEMIRALNESGTGTDPAAARLCRDAHRAGARPGGQGARSRRGDRRPGHQLAGDHPARQGGPRRNDAHAVAARRRPGDGDGHRQAARDGGLAEVRRPAGHRRARGHLPEPGQHRAGPGGVHGGPAQSERVQHGGGRARTARLLRLRDRADRCDHHRAADGQDTAGHLSRRRGGTHRPAGRRRRPQPQPYPLRRRPRRRRDGRDLPHRDDLRAR